MGLQSVTWLPSLRLRWPKGLAGKNAYGDANGQRPVTLRQSKKPEMTEQGSPDTPPGVWGYRVTAKQNLRACAAKAS